MNEHLLEFRNLAVALAVGLLIGLERGWSERAGEEGTRIAGIRTFGLISLLGALWQLLGREAGPWMLATAYLAFGLLVAVGSYLETTSRRQYGITTPVAAMIAFALGALSMAGYLTLASAVAVVVMVLLGLKPVLHRWLRTLEPYELEAVFKLLLVSVVLLPVLPDRTYDPWDALNPYEIWWMVVLIGGISFAGYFAIKIAGASRGILLTGLLAGLVSSTAVTLSLSRLARTQPRLYRVAAASVAVASTTMFLRIFLIVGVVKLPLLYHLGWPLVAMVICGYAGVWLLMRNREEESGEPMDQALRNPLEFGIALRFGALLAFVMVATRVLQELYGSAGIYLMAGLAGISDVDAISLSLSRVANVSLSPRVAVAAILLAAAVNTLVKGLLVAFVAGGRMAVLVARIFFVLVLAGGLVLAMEGWLV